MLERRLLSPSLTDHAMSGMIALIAGVVAYLLYRKRIHRTDNQ
ncbi:MAG: hypothetical protein WCC01_13325 [Acidimicrobiia bacterium]